MALLDWQTDYSGYLKNLIQQTLPKCSKEIIKRLADAPLTGPGGVRQTLGKVDLEFFSKAYFPQYFEHDTPDFHKTAYNELDKVLNNPPKGARIVRAWPRGNAKSSIYNFFTPCNAALYGRRKFLVQVSESEAQAEGFLGDIKNALDDNDYIVEDFGNVEGATWRSDQISLRSVTGETVWIAAVGAGSGIRGLRKAEFRPDILIVDDLDSDESVLTPARISKMYAWFQRALMNLGTVTTDVIVVGTVIAYASVLDTLLKSPTWDARTLRAISSWSASPLWEEWTKLYTDTSVSKDERELAAGTFYKANETEMLEGTEVLWPAGRPYVDLMKIYVNIGEAAFHAEHQNDPVNLDECLFKPDWITYYTPAEVAQTRIVEYYGALDPSLGKTRLADYSAFTVLGRGQNGVMYVIESIIERMHPERIIETLLRLGRQYEFRRFSIEVNQWQDLLRLMVLERTAKEGLYLPIVELRHSRDKVIRVQTMLPYIKNGYVRFNKDHKLLLEQLLGFPKLRHDDGPDSLEMAVRMIAQGPAMEPMLSGTSPQVRRSDDDDDDDLPGFRQTHFYS